MLDINFNDGTATDTAPDAKDNSGTLTTGATIQDGEVVLDGTGGITIGSSSVIDNMTVQQRTISLSFRANDVIARQVLFEEGGTSKGLNIYICVNECESIVFTLFGKVIGTIDKAGFRSDRG